MHTRYFCDREYGAAQYCDLLSTFSNVLAFDEPTRRGFLACIADLIESRFEGGIVRHDLYDLWLARTSVRPESRQRIARSRRRPRPLDCPSRRRHHAGEPGGHRAHSRVLRTLCLTVWLDRGGRTRPLCRPGTGSVASYRPGALREGTGGAGTCLPFGPAALSTETDTPEGRSGPWLAAHQLARGAGGDGDQAPADRGAPRSGERGVQPGLRVDVRHRGFGGVDSAVDARLRQPEPVRVDGAVRLGSHLCDPLHVRHRQWRRGRHDAGSRERRLHPVLGLQPEP